MTDRLTDIEIKIAHIENSVGELSDVLYSQQQLLDRMAQRLDKLAESIVLAGDTTGNNDPAAEKPPHY